jgi:peptidoglycan/xylan/chitin deacetylase (PgdA/CDA1 family)
MKQIFKYLFYEIACPLFLFLRIDKLLRSRGDHQRLIIMYHGVSDRKNFTINGRHLPGEEFERHLQYFKKNFDVVSLRDICDAKSIVSRKRRAIALTFDDGYLNNFEIALPLLKKYNMPATFFISTVGLNDTTYIHPSDYIDLIRNSTHQPVTINGVTFHHHNNQLIYSGKNAYAFINTLNFQGFKTAFAQLREQHPARSITMGVEPVLYKLVSMETIHKFFNDDLFTVGSHSHDHINLANLSTDELKDQLQRSKALLEQCGNKIVDSIAFPYGYFNERVIENALESGYQYLIAAGSVEPRFSKRVFPRIGILNMAGYAFNMLSISRGFRRFGF